MFSTLRSHSAIAVVIAALAVLALPTAASAATEFSLTVETAGSGSGTWECEVDEGPAEPCEAEYPEGTELVVVAEPDEKSEFGTWSGDCGPLECELTMDEDHVATVTFEALEEEFALNIEEPGTGEGTVQCEVESGPEPCEEAYPEDTAVVLIAEAAAGSEFVAWDGECDSVVGEECEVTMDEEKSVEVTFELEPQEFALNIEELGSGTGTVLCEAQEGPEPCVEEYLEGTELVLIATADSGSEFIKWDGECANVTGNECELVMDEERTVAATFDLEGGTEFELEVTVTGEGKVNADSGAISNCRESSGTCSDEYIANTEVVLTETPDAGNEFAGWTGCASEPSPTKCKVTMSAAKSVEAEFAAEPPVEFELEVTVTGEGKVNADSGAISNCRESSGTCSDEYIANTEVVLTETPDAGNEFAGWTGCASEPSPTKCKVTMSAAKSVEAEFAAEPPVEFELEVTVTGEGKVNADSGAISNCRESSGTCSDEYIANTEVVLTETPDAGNEFAGWTGCASEPSPTKCKVTMSAAKSVEAEFVAEPPVEFELEVTVTGEGKVNADSGAISNCRESSGTCSDEYIANTEVVLTETPDAGNEFAGWTGCASEPSPTKCKVTMSAVKSVEAEFVAEPPVEFTLTIKKAGSGSGSVSCNGGACASKYLKGATVTLAAAAASGSTFEGWSGAGCSGTGNCVVTMSAAQEVTATFTAQAQKTCATDPSLCPPKEGTAKAASTASVKSGKASLKLTCSGGACKGTFQLTAKVKQGKKTKKVVIGKASFSLADGASTTLKVKLSGPAKQELAKGKTLKAKLTGTGIAASTVKLKPAKTKARH